MKNLKNMGININNYSVLIYFKNVCLTFILLHLILIRYYLKLKYLVHLKNQ